MLVAGDTPAMTRPVFLCLERPHSDVLRLDTTPSADLRKRKTEAMLSGSVSLADP